MEDVLLIINPKSGVDKHKDSMIKVAARLCEERGLRFAADFTDRAGDACRLARDAAEKGTGTVIVAGGDGTVRDAANGLWGTTSRLGIVPLGSGNGLARSLGISQMADMALTTAMGPDTITIDRGLANSESFYCAFGVGIDAEVSYRFSLDRRRGRTTYIKHVIKEVFKYKPRHFSITVAGNQIETDAMLVAVCNCKQYGNNAYIAPKADPCDGKLDVTVVHSGNFLAKAVAGVELISGTLDRNILVEMFRASDITIHSDAPEKAHLDGEPVEMAPTVRVECEEAGLNVAVPRGVQPFRPILTPVRSMIDDLINDIKKNII